MGPAVSKIIKNEQTVTHTAVRHPVTLYKEKSVLYFKLIIKSGI